MKRIWIRALLVVGVTAIAAVAALAGTIGVDETLRLAAGLADLIMELIE